MATNKGKAAVDDLAVTADTPQPHDPQTNAADTELAQLKAELADELTALRAEKEELAALKAELAKQRNSDARATRSAPAVPANVPRSEEELVDFYAFKDNDKYKSDIFVAVNGKTYRIQRGKHVRIPRYVAEVLRRSMEQDAATADMIEREAASYDAAAKVLGL